MALRRHGLEPSDLDLSTGLSLNDAEQAFRAGEAEYVHVAEPVVQQLLADGAGHLLTALGPENGHLAYSSFAATHRFLDQRPDTAERFTLGFAPALRWLSSTGPSEIAAAVGRFFSRHVSRRSWLPRSPGTRNRSSGRRARSWRNPEFDSLHDILLAAGMCRERQPYEKIVTTGIAERAIAAV